MNNIIELMHWLRQFASGLSEGSATSFMKAMSMSEVVYESIDHIGTWPKEQQMESIELLQKWLDGFDLEGFELSHTEVGDKWLKPMIKGIVDKAPIELSFER